MARVADQHDLAAAAVVDLGLAMHLGHQRAGGVEREQVAAGGGFGHRLGDAVGGEDHGCLGVRDFVEFLDEDRALGLEALDHIAIVDDLVAHIDRRSIEGEGALDRIDRSHHAGAESARRAQQHLQRGLAGFAYVYRGHRQDMGFPPGPCQARGRPLRFPGGCAYIPATFQSSH
jgi:hypothetical protein